MTATLETIFANCADAGRRDRRAALRDYARRYVRDDRVMLWWTFPPCRLAIETAAACPDSPTVTKRLCRALWRDLQAARNLPDYLLTKQQDIRVLREFFAAECALYRKQQRAAMQRAAE